MAPIGGRILTYINDEKADLVMYFYRTDEKTNREKKPAVF